MLGKKDNTLVSMAKSKLTQQHMHSLWMGSLLLVPSDTDLQKRDMTDDPWHYYLLSNLSWDFPTPSQNSVALSERDREREREREVFHLPSFFPFAGWVLYLLV